MNKMNIMTVEEKAGEYAEKTEAEYGFDMHPKSASFLGFLAGHAEAIRFRDPKIELPENVGLYLCKCEKKLGFYFDIVFFNKVWRSDNVIGWRPIENKNHFEGRIEEAGCDFCRDKQGYTIGNMYVCDKCGRQVP